MQRHNNSLIPTRPTTLTLATLRALMPHIAQRHEPIRIRHQHLLTSALQRRMLAPQLRQPANPRELRLLLRRASRLRKRILRIARKSAREISPVVRIIPAPHRNLIARIQLRRPTRRQQVRKRHAPQRRIRHLLCNTLTIMVIQKRHQSVGMRIQTILAQHGRQLRHRRTLHKHVLLCPKHRIVERRRQARIGSRRVSLHPQTTS